MFFTFIYELFLKFRTSSVSVERNWFQQIACSNPENKLCHLKKKTKGWLLELHARNWNALWPCFGLFGSVWVVSNSFHMVVSVFWGLLWFASGCPDRTRFSRGDPGSLSCLWSSELCFHIVVSVVEGHQSRSETLETSTKTHSASY